MGISKILRLHTVNASYLLDVLIVKQKIHILPWSPKINHITKRREDSAFLITLFWESLCMQSSKVRSSFKFQVMQTKVQLDHWLKMKHWVFFIYATKVIQRRHNLQISEFQDYFELKYFSKYVTNWLSIWNSNLETTLIAKITRIWCFLLLWMFKKINVLVFYDHFCLIWRM